MDVEKVIKVIFPRNLDKYMHLNNLSRVEVAKAIGISPSSITFWMNGEKEPRMQHIEALCKLFGCSRNDLLDEKDDCNAPSPLSSDETDLLNGYRKLKDIDKGKILGIIESINNPIANEVKTSINNMDPDQLEAFTKFVALPEEQRNALKMLIKGLQ